MDGDLNFLDDALADDARRRALAAEQARGRAALQGGRESAARRLPRRGPLARCLLASPRRSRSSYF